MRSLIAGVTTETLSFSKIVGRDTDQKVYCEATNKWGVVKSKVVYLRISDEARLNAPKVGGADIRVTNAVAATQKQEHKKNFTKSAAILNTEEPAKALKPTPAPDDEAPAAEEAEAAEAAEVDEETSEGKPRELRSESDAEPPKPRSLGQPTPALATPTPARLMFTPPLHASCTHLLHGHSSCVHACPPLLPTPPAHPSSPQAPSRRSRRCRSSERTRPSPSPSPATSLQSRSATHSTSSDRGWVTACARSRGRATRRWRVGATRPRRCPSRLKPSQRRRAPSVGSLAPSSSPSRRGRARTARRGRWVGGDGAGVGVRTVCANARTRGRCGELVLVEGAGCG
jgi:hypothetical protein